MQKGILCIIIAAVAAASLCGCGKSTAEEVGGKLITSQMTVNDTYDVKLNYQGVVKAKDTKNYSFLSGGRLEKVYAEKGRFVHKGDILARLDAVELKSSAAQSMNNRAISENNLNKTEATYFTNITNAQINIRTIDTSIAAVDSSIAAYRESIAAAEKGINDYRNSIPVAEKGVAALEKTIATDDEQIAAAEENIAAYSGKLESTRQAVDLAKTNLERMETLYEKGAVARSEVESMQVQYNDAEASYRQAEAQMSNYKVSLSQLRAAHDANLASLEGKKQELSAMNTQLDANKAQISNMRAQLDSLAAQRAQTAAQRDTANKELANLKSSMAADVASQRAAENISKLAEEQANRAVSNATLVADADGYVMAVNVKEGEMAGAGTPVVTVKSDTMIVSVGVSMEDYSKLENILEIKINGDIPGEIDSISQYPDEGTRTYTVDIAFSNADLAMGEIVDVELVTERSEGVFIPISSVINIDGIDYVYVVNDDTVTRREVKLGEVKNDTVRTESLKNERIVTSGMKALNDNDKVTEANPNDK